eukprot:351357-Chlamydomonas_euryale.AAC.5
MPRHSARAGRDVSGGTFRVDDLQRAFQRGAERLELLARSEEPTENYLSVRPLGRRCLQSSLCGEERARSL